MLSRADPAAALKRTSYITIKEDLGVGAVFFFQEQNGAAGGLIPGKHDRTNLRHDFLGAEWNEAGCKRGRQGSPSIIHGGSHLGVAEQNTRMAEGDGGGEELPTAHGVSGDGRNMRT